MLIQIASQYLQSHKRLVIPQLGTFIVKEPGKSILFSEMLRRDDGVLRGLLCAEGASELEAAGEIDRFVFEVRHATEHGEEYRLEGFGVLKPGPNGTLLFDYAPQSDPILVPPPVAVPRSGQKKSVPEPSSKLTPEPYLRGLRYGKPHKSTNAYTFVDHAPRRRIDRFLLLAIIAVAMAVAAIAFGYFRQTREEQAEAAIEQADSIQLSETPAQSEQK